MWVAGMDNGMVWVVWMCAQGSGRLRDSFFCCVAGIVVVAMFVPVPRELASLGVSGGIELFDESESSNAPPTPQHGLCGSVVVVVVVVLLCRS